jgi:outer membrane lipoprotein-sorting protein
LGDEAMDSPEFVRIVFADPTLSARFSRAPAPLPDALFRFTPPAGVDVIGQ